MTVICVVQARVASTRLPGKVLADLDGRPLLAFLLDRLTPTVGRTVDRVVVATSDRSADDAVETIAGRAGVETVRGPEEDVLGRFAAVLDRHPADVVVRVTGDCPFVDPSLVGDAVALRDESDADYVSNTLVRTYPDGFDVEVVTSYALWQAEADARDPAEREHVTPFVYRRPARFSLRTLRHTGPPLGHLRCTVDVADDLDVARTLVRRLGRTDAGWMDVVGVMDDPPPRRFALDPVGPDDDATLLALRNEEEAVRWSLDGATVDPATHREWFRSLLDCPNRRAWLARVEDEVVGLVRIDVDDGVGLVSLAVEADHRGHGYSGRLLAGLADALDADQQAHTLRAEIREGNDRSLRAFAAAGYVEDVRDGGVVVMTRARGPEGFGA